MTFLSFGELHGKLYNNKKYGRHFGLVKGPKKTKQKSGFRKKIYIYIMYWLTKEQKSIGYRGKPVVEKENGTSF